MLLEILLIILLIGTILVFFYKQAVEEFRITQTDSFEKVPPLLLERCPIVVYPFPTPLQLWTYGDIQQRKRLAATPIPRQGDSGPIALGSLITKKNVFLPQTYTFSENLASQIGLDVWVKHEIFPTFRQSSLLGPTYSTVTEARIGSQGLQKTYGYANILAVTEGTVHVSLVTEASLPFLPKPYQGRRLSKLTRDDTPLIGQIQTVEVIVRAGSALILPPHWFICWDDEPDAQPSLSVWIELHHPVSRFVKHVENIRGKANVNAP